MNLLSILNVALAQGLTPVTAPDGTSSGDLIGSITAILNGGLVLAAIVAVVFIVIGGIQYITSSGDEDKAGTAKNTVLYAVIGLIVIGLAAALVNFVIGIVGN